MEASKADKNKIVNLLKEGKVEVANQHLTALESCFDVLKEGKKPDFTVTSAKLDCAGIDEGEGRGPWFVITWSTVSGGFGETTFFFKNEKLCCDSESMSKKFVKDVLCKLVDDAKFE